MAGGEGREGGRHQGADCQSDAARCSSAEQRGAGGSPDTLCLHQTRHGPPGQSGLTTHPAGGRLDC